MILSLFKRFFNRRRPSNDVREAAERDPVQRRVSRLPGLHRAERGGRRPHQQRPRAVRVRQQRL